MKSNTITTTSDDIGFEKLEAEVSYVYVKFLINLPKLNSTSPFGHYFRFTVFLILKILDTISGLLLSLSIVMLTTKMRKP